MKSVNEKFSNEEHAYLVSIKKELTWREFILKSAELYKIYEVKAHG